MFEETSRCLSEEEWKIIHGDEKFPKAYQEFWEKSHPEPVSENEIMNMFDFSEQEVVENSDQDLLKKIEQESKKSVNPSEKLAQEAITESSIDKSKVSKKFQEKDEKEFQSLVEQLKEKASTLENYLQKRNLGKILWKKERQSLICWRSSKSYDQTKCDTVIGGK
eukprot:gene1678-447_t